MIMTVVNLALVLIAGILIGYAVRQRQELEQKDIEIETLIQHLEDAGIAINHLRDDVALLEENVTIARSESFNHAVTISMLMKEVERADNASA